ncbi:adrenocorticotropic hormone receptor-like isoform X2 [Montipora foliosa]|uniref:adrenocorticotropic hormone receptor-like isoform X2 n=1 Tax=Montipora foliosa TaxID=591990 RepID=UPI0035F179BB
MSLGASHCQGVGAPKEVSITTLCTAAVYCLFTVPGNLLIILSVLLDPNKNLHRTPFILFILNLAITDLIVGVMVEPLSMVTHWREAHGLSVHNSWLSQFVYFMCCTASLLSLVILTIDRYLAITSPFWYHVNMTNARVLQGSVVIWVLSIACSGLLFVIGFVTYAFVFANLTLFCTIFILLFSYVRVFLAAKKKVKELVELHQDDNERNKAQERHLLWEKKLTKTHLVMLLAFLACYGPACIMIYLMNLCHGCSCEVIHWLRDLHFVLITLNSLVNPFVYALRLPVLKMAFRRLLGPLIFWKRGAVSPESPQGEELSSTSRTNRNS